MSFMNARRMLRVMELDTRKGWSEWLWLCSVVV